MISIEQIKQLETRVHSAVARIRSLTAENTTLKESLSNYEGRIDELEKLVTAFKTDQQEIEAGIIAALSQLDGLEDAVADPAIAAPSPVEMAEDTAAEDTSIEDNQTEDSRTEDTAAEDTDDTRPDPGAESVAQESAAENPKAEDTADRPSPEIDLVESEEDEPELDIF